MDYRYLGLALAIGVAACGVDTKKNVSGDDKPDKIGPDEAAVTYTGPPIAFSGRFLSRADGSKSFGWAASKITTRFQGQSATIGLKVLNASIYPIYFDVSVDGKEPTTLVLSPQKSQYTVTVDSAEPHTISWMRRTELNFGGPVTYTGITYDGAAMPTETPKKRFIEFVGDSISNGYGALGVEQHDPNLPAVSCSANANNESVSIAYTTLTAKMLSADFAVIAFSGRGVAHNQGGDANGLMPSLWTYASPPSYSGDPVAQPYAFADYTPDVVVVNLGTNDFTSALNPNSSARQAQCVPNHDDFVSAYTTFVAQIRTRYPDAQIILAQGPMLGDFAPASRYGCPSTTKQYSTAKGYLQDVISASGANVTFCDLGVQQSYTTGCEYHPSADEHIAMTQTLTACIQQAAGWQ